MIHDTHPELNGKIVVAFEAEDWVWLCDLLISVLNYPGDMDEYAKEDTQHLLDVLRQAENGYSETSSPSDTST